MLRKGNVMHTIPVSIFCPECHKDTDEDHIHFRGLVQWQNTNANADTREHLILQKDYRLQAGMENRLADALEI